MAFEHRQEMEELLQDLHEKDQKMEELIDDYEVQLQVGLLACTRGVQVWYYYRIAFIVPCIPLGRLQKNSGGKRALITNWKRNKNGLTSD